MTDPVTIGGRPVGPGHPCYVVAEIGINHNGDLDLAKRLIEAAPSAGCDAVKFQKRTVEVVYTPGGAAPEPRDSPSGRPTATSSGGSSSARPSSVTIDATAARRGYRGSRSCWDEASVDFVERFDPPCYKIASACLTDDDLLRHHARHRPADDPLHRHEHPGGDRPGGRGARHRTG